MIITKKHLPRRTFLRGALGTMVALPFLDAMIPALSAQAQSAAVPLRRDLHAERHLPAAVASGDGRQRLRVQADHAAARAVPQPPGDHQRDEGAGRQPGHGRRAHGRQRRVAERHRPGHRAGEVRRPVEEDASTSTSPTRSPRTRRCARSRSAPRTWARRPAPATAIRACSSTPSRGATTPARCRWPSIRA